MFPEDHYLKCTKKLSIIFFARQGIKINRKINVFDQFSRQGINNWCNFLVP